MASFINGGNYKNSNIFIIIFTGEDFNEIN